MSASSTGKPQAPQRQDAPAQPSRADRVRHAVEADILTGHLLPGSSIHEAELMATHGVSRTPVREALLLLSQQGLVDILPRAGMRVRQPDAAERVALLECLAEFEALCARLATLRMTAPALQALVQAHEAAAAHAQAHDQPGYERANASFHETLYAACGNAVLVDQLLAVRKRLAAFRRQVMARPGRLQAASAEHAQILAAIQAGRADEAWQAMREHILRKGQAVAELVLAG